MDKGDDRDWGDSKGKDGSWGRRGEKDQGRRRSSLGPFDLEETLEELARMSSFDKEEGKKHGRALERKLLDPSFEEWLDDRPSESAIDRLQDFLNDHLWAFSRAQRQCIVKHMGEIG